MRRLKGLLLIMVVLVYGVSYVKAASYNTPVKSNMSYNECINFQDKRVTTSGDGYFGHCIKATCYGGVWQTQFYISQNMVTCTNGNTSNYYQIMADGCSQYVGSCKASMDVKYCSIVTYYDCQKVKTGAPFTTTPTKPPLTTNKTTTKKVTTAKPSTPKTTTTTPPTTQPSSPVSPKSSNSNLASLQVNPGTISFSNAVDSYQISLPEGTTYVDVAAVPEDPKAIVNIENNQIEDINKPIIITVTAEDGTSRVFMITMVYGQDNNSRLAYIDIEDYEIDFDPDVYSYTLKIKKETSLNITVSTESESATYQITGNADLKNKSKITILVTAEDGSESPYIINIKTSSGFGGIFIVIIMLGVAVFVGYKLVIRLLSNKEGESHYEYE